MIRRSFRIGLRLGLLCGAAFAVVKTVQSRRRSGAASTAPPARPEPAPWQPISNEPPVRVPVAADKPADEPLDEVGEPILEFEAEPPPPVPASETTDPHLDIVRDIVPATGKGAAKAALPPEKKAASRPALAARRAARAQSAPPAKAAPAKAAPAKAASAKRATKKAAPPAPAQPAWVEAEGGVCPPTHPVKAKMTSRLFHLPGMFAYDRTRPDRCYRDGPTAIADGFTSSKR